MRFWILFVSSLLILSFTLTFMIRSWALKYKIVDVPNKRSSHTVPTPRGGGLAIVIVWYLGIFILFTKGNMPPNLFYAFISGLILALVSLLDDLISLKPIIRLIAQFATAVLALHFLGGLKEIEFYILTISSQITLNPLAIIAIVWFINLFNFLDGIDGYASIETIFIASILFVFTSNCTLLIIIASVAGFLIWNWPRAKIFMGDVGSTQLGYILIVFGIYFNNIHEFNIINWVILSSPFWFDATLTLIRRWRNKEVLGEAHKKHAYQRLVQSGFSHQKTDISLILVNSILTLIIFLTVKYTILTMPLLVIVIVCLYLLTMLIDRKKPFT